ncbi:O-antigen ligase family protein [Mycolicibacterium elephantis]|uniref:O-antigen ligase family protein n=1 Tax=Mycolicibacterium elephantis TaxID=81858 RepID=UPI0013F4DAEC|nr:O-antigen ligase family protein [Mycolicibacterium elephantis]
MSRLIAVVLVLVVSGYAAKRKVPLFSNLALIGIFGVFILVAASSLWTQSAEQTSSRIVTFGGLAVTSVALAAALACLEQRGLKSIEYGLIIGAAVVSFLVIDSRIRGDFFAGPQGLTIIFERSTAGAADPNDLALLLAVALPACIWSARWQIRYLVAPATVFAILFTGSRGAIISLLAGAVVAGFVTLLNHRQPFRRIIQSFAAAVIVIWTAWAFLPEALRERLQGIPTALDQGTFTNRTTLWRAAWEQSSENPFLGSGAGTARESIFQLTGINQVIHNIHLSFLAELGIIGWLCFIFALAVAWVGAFRQSRFVAWPLVSIAILTTGTWALSWEYNKLLWVMLITGGALLSASYPTRSDIDKREGGTNK